MLTADVEISFKCSSVSVQGEVVHWLACSLYAACRKGSTPTVGKGLMEGNCVSLTRILRTSKLRSGAVDSALTLDWECFCHVGRLCD